MIKHFGDIGDNAVQEITLHNSSGCRVQILTYGAAIRTLFFPDRNGQPTDVVLGFNKLEDYQQPGNRFLGAVVGPYANRISNAAFTLNNTFYQLSKNRGNHFIHGGFTGLDKVIWTIGNYSDGKEVMLHYSWKDGAEGYPGNIEISLTYSLTDLNELVLTYQATTDRSTHINLTNHTYFNLSGAADMTVLNHRLQLNATEYTAVDQELIPTGEIVSTTGTIYDFSESVRLGDRIPDFISGYDHNMILSPGSNNVRPAAVLYAEQTGISMTVRTSEPGMQLYTSNFLDGSLTGKYGVQYGKYAGICLETQHFPDSPNQTGFPSTLVHPGSTYWHRTSFTFSK